jgi:IBR domain, a half RING-finger domain
MIRQELGEWVVSSKYVNKCPQCRSRVEKNSGCQHMTCGFCRYEWCWVCGMPYNSIVHYKEIGYTFCEMIGQSYFKSSKCFTFIFLLLIGLFMPFIVYFLAMHGVGFSFIKISDRLKTTSYGRKFINFKVDFFT